LSLASQSTLYRFPEIVGVDANLRNQSTLYRFPETVGMDAGLANQSIRLPGVDQAELGGV
jgi:hypothetical protein